MLSGLRVTSLPQAAGFSEQYANPANTRRWPNVGLMLGQRRRRWANVCPTFVQRLVFAGKWLTINMYYVSLVIGWSSIILAMLKKYYCYGSFKRNDI